MTWPSPLPARAHRGIAAFGPEYPRILSSGLAKNSWFPAIVNGQRHEPMTMRAETASDTLTAVADLARQCRRSVQETFRGHLPLYAVAILFLVATIAIATAFGIGLSLDASEVFLTTIPPFLFVGIGLAAIRKLVQLIRVERPERPLSAMGGWLMERFAAGDRPGNIVHALVIFTPLMVSFAALKQAIPKIQPFAWDATFTEWDRVLHFGRLPWEYLQAAIGYPPVTSAITFVYNFWIVVMFGCLFWQAFTERSSRLRLQFLLAFAFTWFIGGNVLAVIFSSAGPCFYGRLGIAPDPYGMQIEYLRAAADQWPVWSVRVQDLLWNSFVSGDGLLNGISAMPSIHVTSSVVMMYLGWRSGRIAGIALTIFAAFILVGSVHLGWHYAVDGYAGILLATVFWLTAGAIARRAIPEERPIGSAQTA
jgi:hypothetical protein